ncbi:MAG TPA: helix-turn-helix transcriptional regulator [Thermoanaerobaculia bacterium]|nr:helix-turn-helix transcriptional regulator [Thermoanaerobaculia bacterium]
MSIMVGEKLRQARVARQMSLADVAGEANVSAATLSRVERDKQAIDVSLFLTLARVLNAVPGDLLTESDDSEGDAALAARIAAMQTRERTKLWRQLNEERRELRTRKRADLNSMATEVEELLAQMDFLREEIESVRARLVKKR